jgi:hypothetical protein
MYDPEVREYENAKLALDKGAVEKRRFIVRRLSACGRL